MTTETVHKIELADIARVSFECKDCHAVVALQARTFTTQFKCPLCGAPWAPTDSAAHKALLPFIQGFTTLLERQADLKFVLRLEIIRTPSGPQ